MCNVVPRVLRKPCTGVFFMQCCLEPLGHYREFWPVHSCPKSFNTTLNRTFSCALLSGTSRTTLHRAFTCALLLGASWTTLHRVFVYAILSQEYPLHRKNISQEKHYLVLSLRLQKEKILFNIVLILLGKPLHRVSERLLALHRNIV